MNHQIHIFRDTIEAYDSTQIGVHVETGEPVNRGDLLFIPDEEVLGVADTWPIAVTEKCGELHKLADGYDYLPEEFGTEGPANEGLDIARALLKINTEDTTMQATSYNTDIKAAVNTVIEDRHIEHVYSTPAGSNAVAIRPAYDHDGNHIRTAVNLTFATGEQANLVAPGLAMEMIRIYQHDGDSRVLDVRDASAFSARTITTRLQNRIKSLRQDNSDLGYHDAEAQALKDLNMFTYRALVPGRIGGGTKVHNLYIEYLVTREKGNRVVARAWDTCGSSRFTLGGRSRLNIMAAGTQITCKKCGG